MKDLDPARHAVLRQGATEPPFSGELNANKRAGTYHCGACGQLLFASDAKYDSRSGWPSFYEPANAENVKLLEDNSHGLVRNEVRCAHCDSHLGHLFEDGPEPTGQRYCMNSLALDFEEQ